MIISGSNTIILVLDWFFLLSAFFIGYIRENAMLRYQIIKNEKFSIISELASSVAHEVRNPLTVVRVFIQLAGQELHENEHKNKDYFELVLSELVDRALYTKGKRNRSWVNCHLFHHPSPKRYYTLSECRWEMNNCHCFFANSIRCSSSSNVSFAYLIN
ncbi:histidine kinase dimerization/phospho-acceptor domain-containing protein [Bacillus sp. V2I10]|uniref:histidine kinase dimerization/phospho-acceptor domain-containing protein n=1 Tax=Bacillus sp. V2I10 TaxID=3042276 RepID=UPI00359465D1